MRPDVDILAVDDRPEDLTTICAILASPEYNVIRARSGSEALRRLLTRDFALILLDVVMPDIDGFEVARIVKQRERSRLTPIIFLTGGTNDISYIYKAYSLGAVDYLIKPFDPDLLRAKVKIFAELFCKDRRIMEQAEALRLADLRERERELTEVRRASERRYRNLAEAIPQIVWTADTRGEVTYFNERWVEHTGTPMDRSLGTQWQSVLHPADAAVFSDRWREALEKACGLELELRLRGRDQSYRWFLLRAAPERNGQGRVVGWLGTYTDFDDRKRAFDAAERAIRVRDEFLSIASHELRTPLMTLDLRLKSLGEDLTKEGESPDPVSRKLAAAVRQSDRLIGLVDDLLDVSRVNNGQLSLHRGSFDMADAAREVIDQLAETAAGAGCSIVLEVGSPVVGGWDRTRIEQVFRNLLSNAIKYAPKSEIGVFVGERSGLAVAEVRDHGMGIAQKDVERIFGQFERAVHPRNYGGLGLGLFIVQQIARAHAGEARVESKLGEGSRFWIELPFESGSGVHGTLSENGTARAGGAP
ncbi:MAG TPA: ATP-binding protein [Polyangiaceae bacterium]